MLCPSPVAITEVVVYFVMIVLQVTGAHRSKLPYTEAVLLEVMRISDTSVFTGFHSASVSGMTFRGYDIPP